MARTEENQYLIAGPDKARELEAEARRLLGYSVHDGIATGGGCLGAIELVSPDQLLDSGAL
jgi:hypothetical protein